MPMKVDGPNVRIKEFGSGFIDNETLTERC